MLWYTGLRRCERAAKNCAPAEVVTLMLLGLFVVMGSEATLRETERLVDDATPVLES